MGVVDNYDDGVHPEGDDTLLSSLYSEFSMYEEPRKVLSSNSALAPYQQWRAEYIERKQQEGGTAAVSPRSAGVRNACMPADIFEPYRRWKEGQLHPQGTHDMVDEHMEAFFAEFSDIAHDAIDSDIVYTELKQGQEDIRATSHSSSLPLVMVLSITLLSVVLLGGWFAHKTSEGIDSLRQQLDQLNQHVPKLTVSAAVQTDLSAPKPVVNKSVRMSIPAMAATVSPSDIATAKIAPEAVESKQTEIQTTHPNPALANHVQGDWMIVASSHLDRTDAEQALADLHAMKIDSKLSQAVVYGRTWFRVILPGFRRADALRYLKQHKQSPGFEGAWVGKNH